jgi:hypothetical protein
MLRSGAWPVPWVGLRGGIKTWHHLAVDPVALLNGAGCMGRWFCASRSRPFGGPELVVACSSSLKA